MREETVYRVSIGDDRESIDLIDERANKLICTEEITKRVSDSVKAAFEMSKTWNKRQCGVNVQTEESDVSGNSDGGSL